MTWLRIRLTEEQQRVVNEERSAHPNPRIRERMLVLWLLHNGATRQYAAQIVGVSGPRSSDMWPRFERAAWMACGGGSRIARKARWPPIAS